MRANDMSSYQKHQFRRDPYCHICGNKLYPEVEDIIMARRRISKCVMYAFYHMHCAWQYDTEIKSVGYKFNEEVSKCG